MNAAAQLVITLSADGNLNLKLTGPAAGNRPMMIGLLELAKQSLLAEPKPQTTPPILLAQAALPRNGA